MEHLIKDGTFDHHGYLNMELLRFTTAVCG